MKRQRIVPFKEQKLYLTKAYEMGKVAFGNGIKSAPFYDKEFTTWLYSLKLPVCKEATQILEAWNRGWHQANLATPIIPATEHSVICVSKKYVEVDN